MAFTLLWTCEVRTVFTIFLSYFYLQHRMEKCNQIDQLDFRSKTIGGSLDQGIVHVLILGLLSFTECWWNHSDQLNCVWMATRHPFSAFWSPALSENFPWVRYFRWVVVVISVILVVVISVIFASLLPCPHANIRKWMSANVCHSKSYAHFFLFQAAVDSQCCCFCCFEINPLGKVKWDKQSCSWD